MKEIARLKGKEVYALELVCLEFIHTTKHNAKNYSNVYLHLIILYYNIFKKDVR